MKRLSKNNYKYLFAIVIICLLPALGGCGGVWQQTPDKTAPIEKPVLSGKGKKTIKISEIINSTGIPKYDSLRHYIHLKTAQSLTETANWQVVNDEILKLFNNKHNIPITDNNGPAQYEIAVELIDVEERIGGTWKFAIFSAQHKSAGVKLRVRLSDTSNGNYWIAGGKDWSSKGAWGVIAKVNRDSMIKGKGIWQLDNSMLGIAAQRALDKAIVEMTRKARSN